MKEKFGGLALLVIFAAVNYSWDDQFGKFLEKGEMVRREKGNMRLNAVVETKESSFILKLCVW
jgi:hypothetical protein